MKRTVLDEGRAFTLALRFLTRLPVPAPDTPAPGQLAASIRYYPLVGALVGGLCAGVFWLANAVLPGPVAVIFAAAAGLAITGALHEDGLADTFDGLGAGFAANSPANAQDAGDGGAQWGEGGDAGVGGSDEASGVSVGDKPSIECAAAQKRRMLEAMRDSRLGTFGVIALMVALGLKIALLAPLAPLVVCVALVAGHGLSRLSCILVMQSSIYVRESGAATSVAQPLNTASWLVVLITGLVLLAGLFHVLGPLAAFAALVGVVAGHTLMRLCCERKLGGYTGDTLGAVQQASEIGLYLGVCAALGAWA